MSSGSPRASLDFASPASTKAFGLGWSESEGDQRLEGHGLPQTQTQTPLFPRPVYPGKFPNWIEHEIDLYILWLIVQRDDPLPTGARDGNPSQ